MGFQVKKREMVFGMDMAATRDRCLRVVERCRQRQAIPDDVQVVSFQDVPMHKVDQFFQGFFDDGVGPGRLGLDERLSLVVLRGEQIIAGYVGHVQDDIWISPRLAVLDEYQNGWATPMLVGYGCKCLSRNDPNRPSDGRQRNRPDVDHDTGSRRALVAAGPARAIVAAGQAWVPPGQSSAVALDVKAVAPPGDRKRQCK